MSLQLINRSPDLKRLRDEGYNVDVLGGYLVVKHVPYVNSKKEIKRGILVSKLTLAGDVTTTPDSHTIYFSGEYPHNDDGSAIEEIRHSTATQKLVGELVVHHMFSAKPKPADRYPDYYAKITTYVAILTGPARRIDPSVSAQTFPVVEAKEDESVFKYIDTASSRAEITTITQKLEVEKIAIVGLGGSGSYVLDLVAKTPVKEIHLFDGDTFFQHNAFRSPGGASIEELAEKLPKVVYFERLYSKMRRSIIGHPFYLDAANVEELRGMNFVFLCLDRGEPKRLIVEKLEEFGIPFIDVGMGVYAQDGSLGGVLTATCSTPAKRDHVWAKDRIKFSGGEADNEYANNIQIADLNALNAALAVIKWKKLLRFYIDLDQEHFCAYTIDGNALVNEDRP